MEGRRLDRNAGVALWRQIADQMRAEVQQGLADANGKLPAEAALADRFGVNRHTVRAAIAALVKEGALRAERGRGTFVVAGKRLSYPIGRRTRFSAGLRGQAGRLFHTVLDDTRDVRNADATTALDLPADTSLLRLETLSFADGVPISRGTHFFEAAPFDGIADALRARQSMTEALRQCGVPDYVRQSTLVSAGHADGETRTALRLSPGALVLITKATNADPSGRAISYSISRFAADRVEFDIEAPQSD